MGYSWEHNIPVENSLEREMCSLYNSSWGYDEDNDRITGGFI
jgi:hypothetical protein